MPTTQSGGAGVLWPSESPLEGVVGPYFIGGCFFLGGGGGQSILDMLTLLFTTSPAIATTAAAKGATQSVDTGERHTESSEGDEKS